MPKNTKPAKPNKTEKWLQSQITTNNSPETLSRFGLKNEKEVMDFIQSPAGKAVIAEIDVQIGLEKVRKEQAQLQHYEQDILMHRLRSAMFSWSVKETDQANRQQQDIVFKQNTQAIKRAKAPEPVAKADQTPYQILLDASISSYRAAIASNEAQLAIIDAKGIQLAIKMAELQEQGAMITEKYDMLENIAREVEEGIIGILGFSNEKEDMSKVDEEFARMARKIDAQAQESASPARTELMTTARVHLETMREDIVGVREGQKYFADIDGNKVTSLKNAHFLLNKDQQILKDAGGQFHLIQDLGDKQKKQTRLDSVTPLLATKQIITYGRQTEQQTHENNVAVVAKETENNNTARAQLMAQARVLKAELAKSERAREATFGPKASVQTPSPEPTVTAKPRVRFAPGTKPGVAASNMATTQMYRTQISQFRSQLNDEPLTLESMKALISELGKVKGNSLAVGYLQNQLDKVPQTGRMTQQQTAEVFKALDALAVKPEEPDQESGYSPGM